jgi:hypothetical protein
MSALLDSLLDDERRVKCRVNDGAMAMGRPITASLHAAHAVRHTYNAHHDVAPSRSERLKAVMAATEELG